MIVETRPQLRRTIHTLGSSDHRFDHLAYMVQDDVAQEVAGTSA